MGMEAEGFACSILFHPQLLECFMGETFSEFGVSLAWIVQFTLRIFFVAAVEIVRINPCAEFIGFSDVNLHLAHELPAFLALATQPEIADPTDHEMHIFQSEICFELLV